MKTIITTLALALTSCAGIDATLQTRFGDISTHGKSVSITPKLPGTIIIDGGK